MMRIGCRVELRGLKRGRERARMLTVVREECGWEVLENGLLDGRYAWSVLERWWWIGRVLNGLRGLAGGCGMFGGMAW